MMFIPSLILVSHPYPYAINIYDPMEDYYFIIPL